MRRFAVISMLLLTTGFSIPSTAIAQQGYEFGIRFQNPQFATPNFRGFSFQQPTFGTISATPIQFKGIRFPAFNSQVVRRVRDTPREGTTPVGEPTFVAPQGWTTATRPRGEFPITPNRLDRRDPFSRPSGLPGGNDGRIRRQRQITRETAVFERATVARVRGPFLAVSRPIDDRGRQMPAGDSGRSPDYRSEHLARGRRESTRSAYRTMPTRTVDSRSRSEAVARR